MIGSNVAPRSTTISAVRYPFARTPTGAISIEKYAKGTPATCFGCDRALVAKQGHKNRWHFAHAVDNDATCNAETALHRLSKLLIQDGFARAVSEHRSYPLRWPCASCGTARDVDATQWWSRVVAESSATAGTRSDLRFEGGLPIVVEIVVTHDIEDGTAERYAHAELPVFIVRPTWETVGALGNALIADDALNVRSDKCPTCRTQRETERRHKVRLDQLRARLGKIQLVDERIAEHRLAGWPPKFDRLGRTLYPGVRRTVADQAIRLLMVGFIQRESNRWVFVLHLPDGIGAVYAGMGGTEWEPLWSCPTPAFWIRLSVDDGVRERYVEVVATFLEKHGLCVSEQLRWDLSVADHQAVAATSEGATPLAASFSPGVPSHSQLALAADAYRHVRRSERLNANGAVHIVYGRVPP